MINILYCVPALYNPGGMERILTEKINYLVDTGKYSITIMTTDQMGKAFYFDLDKKVNIVNLDLDFNRFFSEPIIKKYINIKKLLKTYRNILENYLIKENIDICISLGGKEIEFLYKMNVSSKKICELHFSIGIREQFMLARGNNFKNKLLGKYRTYQIMKQTRLLDQLVVLTKKDEEKLTKTHRNITQIYNFSSFNPTNKSNLQSKIIVSIGKLDPQKGFDLLIEACRYVETWNGWQLHIYGQGPDEEKLLSKLKKNNLEDKIYFKGVNSNISEVYQNASLFVLSSRYEGFPMVLLEAISFGLPLVSFDCETGPDEVINNNDCGLLVENSNVMKLADAIQRMINNNEEREQMSKIAFDKSKLFSKKEIMNKWQKLFSELVATKNKS